VVAREAVEALLRASPEWRYTFKTFCFQGRFRLRAQTWQFRDELRDRGHEFEHEDLEDALFDLACALLPDSPAARWDTEWATELTSWAVRYLAERYEGGADRSVLEPWAEKLYEAGVAEDRRAYHAAIRGYVKAGLEAFEAARRSAA
jgi:hypothetical protein